MDGFPVIVDTREPPSLANKLADLGLPVERARLDFGDVSLWGNGPDEAPVSIGVERKEVTDLVSSMLANRLSGHQVPGMTAAFGRCYLLVEGKLRECKETGLAMSWDWPNREWKYLRVGRDVRASEVSRFLLSLSEFAGVRVARTQSAEESAFWLRDLWAWWSRPYASHQSHSAKAKAVPVGIWLQKAPLVARIACELPGVGQRRATSVAKAFSTAEAMFRASVEDWEAIEGFGPALARKAWEALRK